MRSGLSQVRPDGRHVTCEIKNDLYDRYVLFHIKYFKISWFLINNQLFYLLFGHLSCGSLKYCLNRNIFLNEKYLLLQPISESLHFLRYDFQDDNQLEYPPIAHIDYE